MPWTTWITKVTPKQIVRKYAAPTEGQNDHSVSEVSRAMPREKTTLRSAETVTHPCNAAPSYLPPVSLVRERKKYAVRYQKRQNVSLKRVVCCCSKAQIVEYISCHSSLSLLLQTCIAVSKYSSAARRVTAEWLLISYGQAPIAPREQLAVQSEIKLEAVVTASSARARLATIIDVTSLGVEALLFNRERT